MPDPSLSSNAVLLTGNWNRYAYVGGDPINKGDPQGLCSPQDDPPCYSATGTSQGSGGVVSLPSISSLPPTNTVAEWDDEHPAAVKKVKLSNVSKSGAKENAILDAFRDIAANLDDKCARFLGGRDAVLATIGALIDTDGSPLVAHGGVDPNSIAAFTGGRSGDFEGNSLAVAEAAVGRFAILVNDNGAFFNSGYSTNNGRLQGNSSAARDFILLHELAHSLSAPGFQADFGDSKAGRSNDNLINSNCAGTFNH